MWPRWSPIRRRANCLLAEAAVGLSTAFALRPPTSRPKRRGHGREPSGNGGRFWVTGEVGMRRSRSTSGEYRLMQGSGKRFQHLWWRGASGDARNFILEVPGDTHWRTAVRIFGGGRCCPGEVCSGLRSRGPLLLRLCCTPGWMAEETKGEF